MELLEKRGAQVEFHDPFLAEIPKTREHMEFAGRRSVPLTAPNLAASDLAIICTDHDGVDYGLIAERCPLIVDTRNVCARHGLRGDRIIKA
jgi:UDP-N-acetyl-D-glucosamine dehydrogenase